MADVFVRIIAASFSSHNDKWILPFNQYFVDSSKPQLEGFSTALRMGFSLVCLHFKHDKNPKKEINVECLTQENLDVIFGGYRCEERHNCYLSEELRKPFCPLERPFSFIFPRPRHQEEDCSPRRRHGPAYSQQA